MPDEHYTVQLDLASGEGHILIRDAAPYALVEAVFAELIEQGWHEVDPDEAVEPHEFADGGLGVKSYLYRTQDLQEVADGVAAARG